MLRNPRVATLLFLGFSSGLPLALTSGTLQSWLATLDVDITTIGLFTVVGLPYILKFLWAPLMDRYVPALLGRRRGWIALTQLLLGAGIAALGGLDPQQAILLTAIVAVAVAFLSASQDVAFDAYSTDVLRPVERGTGAATRTAGYRMAMLTSGGLALILSDQIGWRYTYWLMAGLMLALVVATLLGPEPERRVKPPTSLLQAVVEPLGEFVRRPTALALLGMVVLYKLGDAAALSLSSAFLIRGLGFTPTDVGLINKVMAIGATLLGVFAGGLWLARLGLYRALMVFGLLQALTNLLFMWLAMVGKSYPVMIVAVGAENLAGGMGTAAFVALLMAMCDLRYSAFQFALLSALASLPRVFVGPAAGFTVDAVGWAPFFLATFFAALPGLAVLWALRVRVADVDRSGGQGLG